MKKKLNKYFLRTLNIIFFSLLLLCFYIIISSKLTGFIPNIGGYQFVTVLTGSMNPEITAGSLILIKNSNDPADLKVNDVITFESPRKNDQLITHRIVEIKKENSEVVFITKGDSNTTTDSEVVSANNIYGKYQNITIPYAGFIFELTKTDMGLFIFLIIPIFILMISTIGDFCPPLNRKKPVMKGGDCNNY